VAIITFLALLGLTGSGLLDPWTRLLRQIAGWGVYPLILTVAGLGLYILLSRIELPVRGNPAQFIGLEMMLLALLAFVHLILGEGLVGALAGRGGGLIGWALSDPLLEFLGPLLTLFIIFILLVFGLALVLKITWRDIILWLNRTSLQLQVWSNELEIDIAERESQREQREIPQRDPDITTPPQAPAPEIHWTEDELIIIEDSAPEATTTKRRDKRLPAVDILEEGVALAMTTEEIDDKKRKIEETLGDFGLPATVTEIRRGPAVTQFGVQPGYIERPGPDGQPKLYKVRVNQIAALSKDLALALAVPRLRIEAPVPGRGIVGVEVPNAETSVVRLKTVVESEAFQKIRSPLAVALGRDVAGAPIATNLATLPHLLIAGTTGSGKSVCLNALISCLVFNNTPEHLRLVMIDPKKVELIRFNGLPHLLGKVEVEPERVVGVLRWLTAEMDRRYELFEAINAKHLKDYNRRVARMRGTGDNGRNILPYIGVFLDELADLMALYPADVERTLCRLAQMARATGIHLVVATQRPSTDVITGLIKANFPARASFAVTSNTDSRVILDTVGAESLMGQGDMLFLPPDASAPIRVQGCFVSDHEIESIVSHWQKMTEEDAVQAGTVALQERIPPAESPAEAPVEAPWEKQLNREAFVSERDEMLEDAIELAKKHDKLSTSLIQRRLRIGYPRAARLMEALYEMGLVEDPKEGGKTRRTYVQEDDDPLEDFLAQSD
jgi:S-DNA-T family DNA segregation ATPase FtsK/SpoIIIE